MELDGCCNSTYCCRRYKAFRAEFLPDLVAIGLPEPGIQARHQCLWQVPYDLREVLAQLRYIRHYFDHRVHDIQFLLPTVTTAGGHLSKVNRALSGRSQQSLNLAVAAEYLTERALACTLLNRNRDATAGSDLGREVKTDSSPVSMPVREDRASDDGRKDP